MRKIWIVLALCGALWLAVEMIAPQIVEARFEERVRARTADAVGINADIDSFPFVTRLVLTGNVRRLTVRLDEVVRRRITFAELTYELRGIELERRALLRQAAELERIDSGVVSAVLTPRGLAEVFGAAAQLGQFSVEVREGRLMLLRNGGAVFAADIPTDLFPCLPSGRMDAARIQLQCEFTEIPDALIRAASR